MKAVWQELGMSLPTQPTGRRTPGRNAGSGSPAGGPFLRVGSVFGRRSTLAGKISARVHGAAEGEQRLLSGNERRVRAGSVSGGFSDEDLRLRFLLVKTMSSTRRVRVAAPPEHRLWQAVLPLKQRQGFHVLLVEFDVRDSEEYRPGC